MPISSSTRIVASLLVGSISRANTNALNTSSAEHAASNPSRL
jgi:hypothetical protein